MGVGSELGKVVLVCRTCKEGPVVHGKDFRFTPNEMVLISELLSISLNTGLGKIVLNYQWSLWWFRKHFFVM